MATAMHGLRSTAKGCMCNQMPHYRFPANSIGPGRAFSTTLQRPQRRNSPSLRAANKKLRESKDPKVQKFLEDQSKLKSALRKEQRRQDQLKESYHRIDAIARPYELARVQRRRLKETFMNMGEPEPWEGEHTMQDDDDDMNSLAHGELEQHREMRHYARLAAWEMPLLSSALQMAWNLLFLHGLLMDEQNWQSHFNRRPEICPYASDTRLIWASIIQQRRKSSSSSRQRTCLA